MFQSTTAVSVTTGGLIGGGPDTSPVVEAAVPPPALSGGTLLMANDHTTAVAADPDRDLVYWTNLSDPAHTVHQAALMTGDEPGRIAQDAAGLIHVALRRAGAVVTIDLGSGAIVRRTKVCPAPRGIAFDASANAIAIACVGGELVRINAATDAVMSSVALDNDLRDVVPLGGGWAAITRFRSAEVLLVDGAGIVHSRTRPPADANDDPHVAWRAVAVPGVVGEIAVSHEIANTQLIDLSEPGDMYQGMIPLMRSAVTFFQFDMNSPGATPTTRSEGFMGGLPVDIAFDPLGQTLDVALYAGRQIGSFSLPSLQTDFLAGNTVSETATGVAFDSSGRHIAFAREPARFILEPGQADEQVIAIPGAVSVRDTGHDLFHFEAQGGIGLACASCHPEGRDDGRVWQFNIGPRRTPSLVGGILATAPFHWDGSLKSMQALTDEVYTRRMGGMVEDAAHECALERFLDAIPRIANATQLPSTALAHGKALFESSDVGCSGCHSGEHFTDNSTVNVGTGQPFQTPSLVGVALRAPFMSNGCAATLADRFGSCGGGDQHGATSQLSKSDIADLVVYLQSL